MFSLLYILVLIIVWVYFFVYSQRNNIDLPLGFAIVISGNVAAGYAINIFDDSIGKINISVSLPFLIGLLGIAWNIINIRELFYVGKLKWFFQLIALGLIPGLLFGFGSVAALGFGYFEANSEFTATALILATIQISVAEEILIRGFFLGYLRKNGVGAVFAIFFQSVIFAVAHVPRYFDNWIALLINFLVGIIAGYLTLKTKSLIPGIVFHIFSNLIGILWWLVVR